MSFVVATCEVTLLLTDVFSLKEKRSILRRLIQRTRNHYPISIAEVDELDNHTVGVIAFAIVSNDRRYANALVEKVVKAMDEMGLARIEDYAVEIVNY